MTAADMPALAEQTRRVDAGRGGRTPQGTATDGQETWPLADEGPIWPMTVRPCHRATDGQHARAFGQAVTAARPNTDRQETGALHEAHTWTRRLFTGPGGVVLTDVAVWCPGWPVVP